MTDKIDPREVLTYLNELGYTNISAQQLKDFIKDLKKIMKYDYRYGGASMQVNETSLHSMKESSYSSQDMSDSRLDSHMANKENVQSKTTSEKSSSTQAPLQKPAQKGKLVEVHIFENKTRNHHAYEHCIHLDSENGQNSKNPDQTKSKSSEESKKVSVRPQSTESTIKSIPAVSSGELVSKQSQTSSKHVKIKKAFIRPAVAKTMLNKCDPVALYHYYQSEWKKTKIPGQDSRDDLRWAVRARMLSGPKVEVKSKCNIPRCGWSR